MQTKQQDAIEPANAEDNRTEFWSTLKRIAVKGAERPEALNHDEIGRICRVVLVGMMGRAKRRDE